MGIQKQKWTQEEEDALIAGVEKHGPGKWKNILIDPKFAPFLATRTNVDLKDKWRNLNVSNGSRVPRLKAASAASAALQNATPAAALTHQAAPSESDQDVKNVPRYNTMIFEALTTLKDANGSDLNAIVSFIEVFNRLGALLSKFEPEEVEVLLLAHEVRLEKYKKEKHEVPQNFRRELTTRLRRLVSQGSLEKVQNCYKIKREASLGTKPQGQSPVSGSMVSNDPMKEAADNAAYTVADAENKSYLAAEAVKELERLSLMAEDTDLMLQLATEFYEKCSRDGDLLRAMQGL